MYKYRRHNHNIEVFFKKKKYEFNSNVEWKTKINQQVNSTKKSTENDKSDEPYYY